MSGAGGDQTVGGAVTARWADALYNVAARANAIDEVRQDTVRLSVEVARPAVAAFFFGGGVSETRRKEKLGALLDSLHPLTRNFVRLLFDRRRQAVLQGIGAAFHRRVLEARGEVEGTLESAHPLPEAEVEAVAAKVGTLLGKGVRLRPVVNPELVAGVRVLVGARMLDASVQGRLAGLRHKLMTAPLPAAR
ncbi:MAG: ATP synthase F1 subunit delta [Planctomycetota bacterium]